MLKEWREIDKKYVSTSATTFIFKSLQHNRGVIITGSPGCGKSAAAHHVALKLEKEGYEIVPCDDPSEILQHFTTEKIQVFVVDDVCGKFALNQQKADSWDQYDGKLNMLLELNQNDDKKDSTRKYEEDGLSKSMDNCSSKYNEDNSTQCKEDSSWKVKFIVTCRENIYVHKAFPKLNCLSLIQCSFSTNYKISPDEMRKIALSYLSEDTTMNISNIVLYDFFPLMCALYSTKVDRDPRFFSHPVEIIEKEISVMKIKSEKSFLCLSLLVLRNNKIIKNDITSENMEQLLKNICRNCHMESVVSMVSIQNCFESLKDIYISEAEGTYTAIHDKMFDIISAAIAPSVITCLIEFADIKFFANRIQLLSMGRSSLRFVIYIQPEYESIHFNRQHKEAMKGNYWEVFGGIQAENKAYRKLLISFLKEQDTYKQTSYVPGDDGLTPLFVSSSLGYTDFVEYFIEKCRHHLEVKDNEGRSSFYVACKNGHVAVVNHLMEYYEDINAANVYKTTALSTACSNGHSEVVKLLLDNKKDINRTNKFNRGALHKACLNGNVQLVSLLFSAYYLDITIRDTHAETTLLKSCQKGHFQGSEHLKEFSRNVNQQSDLGRTPLFIACLAGNYETVKFLLDLNRPILNRCVDTTIKDNKGFSILHAACIRGHTRVVKFLIGVDMNVNDTTIIGCTPLFLACQEGHYDTVKFLLDLNGQIFNSRVDTTIKPDNGWSALHAACLNGHTDIARLLIDVDMNVNDTSNDGFTPLYVACMYGNYDTVKFLLDLNGDNLNSCVDTTINNRDDWSVLHVACFKGHTGVVKLLVKIGLNVNARLITGFTPLHLACVKGNYETVKYLLDLNGDKLNSCVDTTKKNQYEWSVVHVACFNGHTQVVKLLVDIGLNLNDTSKNGSTPLFLACQNGHYETVKYLLNFHEQTLRSRADITIKQNDGFSVLHTACSSGHTDIVRLLIGVGLNINDTTNNGCTPLHLACHEGHCDTVKLLLSSNGQKIDSCINTTLKDNYEWSAFHAACFNGHTDVIKLLIERGININDTTSNGYTPLYLGCRQGHCDTVKLLLNLNEKSLNTRVNTAKKDEDGWSVLHVACSNGHKEVVKLLIDIGMNINDISIRGETPLYLACQNGHYETVKFLLDLNGKTSRSRVDTTMKDTNGRSVFDAAFSNRHIEVVNLLIDVDVTRKNDCVIF